MSKMTILVGIPGSGKSTLAEKMRARTIPSDQIRARLTGDINDQASNDKVFRIFAQQIRDALKQKVPIVVDSTAVTQRAHELLLDLAREANTKPTVVIFTDADEARRRNKARDRVVPDHVMDDMEVNLKDIRHFLRDHADKYKRIIEVN